MDAEKLVSILLEEVSEVDDLVNNHIKLVYKVANDHFGYIPDKAGLISAGQAALFHAAEVYGRAEVEDGAEKRPFLNYAYTSIRNAMSTEAGDYMDDENAKGFEIDKHEEGSPLDEPTVSSPKELATQSTTTRKDSSKILIKLVNELPDAQRQVATGVLAGKTYVEIADEMEVSKAYISTLAATTFSKLALKLRNAGFVSASDFFKESLLTEQDFRDALNKIIG